VRPVLLVAHARNCTPVAGGVRARYREPSMSRHTLGILCLALAAWPARAEAQRPVHTFSIVARDPATGQIGVAVQSHWFSVGSVVSWARPGVGAVATQSFIDPGYGPKGLDLMACGIAADAALRQLLAVDEQRDVRQVAFVDAHGRVAAHTGTRAIAAAGHRTGAGYAVQANIMASDAVWPAMATAFEQSTGELADRMLAALEAGQRAGGDLRGMQSASLLVVSGKSTNRPWVGGDIVVDLRVDDHGAPIDELKRLLQRHRAYARANRGDELMAEKKVDAALREYAEAARLAPDMVELPFWHAVTLVSVGREREGLAMFRDVFAREPRWKTLVPRLPAAGLLPDDPKLIERILGASVP
jgi:uncharacterized Ntn-hydrolase superfamily protein